MRSPVMSALFLSFVLALPVGMTAQTSTTSVRGTVTDKSGAMIAGAKVTLSNPQRGFEWSTTTSPAGAYEFLQLTPATYTLTIEAPGFRKSVQTNVELLVNTPATLNATLQVGALSETIEVSAEGSIVNTTDASIGNAFSEHQVKELPLEGRNVPDLLTLQAGVTYTGNRPDINKDNDTRSGSVNGARSDQSNITLDGVDVNDQGSGYAFTSVLPVTLDSVEEFRVTTSNYNADQGRSSGAQVALVTKSGTNTIHGSLYEYLRNTATSANDYFIKGSEIAQGLPNKPPKLIRNIPGGSLGGPILKNRLFFFVNFEATRQREENSVIRVVPSDSLRQGILQYQDVNGGVTTLTVQDIINMDPTRLGPNPASMAYFNTYPSPNDISAGDGYNFTGYRFKAPVKIDKNYYIGRLDYKITQNGNHTLFWRGAAQNVSNAGVPFLPGQPPQHSLTDHSKGFVAGYTALLSPTLVNNFRWGFTRQSVGDQGNSTQQWVIFRSLDQGYTRSRNYQMPVHNFVDDVSWHKGRHTFGFGTNLAFLRNPRLSTLGSFSDGSANAAWLNTGGFANTNSPFDPTTIGKPEVFPDFNNSYDFPLIALLGMVTEDDATYNYAKDGSVFSQGAAIGRHFAMSAYEFYAQDAFRWKPNLTITFGLRYNLFSPPWETTGMQVAPSFSLGKLLQQHGTQMLEGTGVSGDPLITFNLAGPANGKGGYYDWDKKNFAPRIALAYSPRPESGWLKKLFGSGDKTSIRAGFGMAHDHIGMGLLNTFDLNGSFGLSTTLTNPAGVETAATAPRLADMHTIPATDRTGQVIFYPAPPGQFPQTPPFTADTGGFAIAWGLDDTIKTPYSYTFDFSVGRELPHRFSVEASYVGRLGRHLLSQRDLAMPINLVDPKSGIGYFSAAGVLAQLSHASTPTSAVTSSTIGPTAAYWQNIMGSLPAGGAYGLFCSGGSTPDVVQAVYDLYSCYTGNETSALAILDEFGGLPDANPNNPGYYPLGKQNTFFNRQYSSLYAWSTVGNSSYNALQVSLRKHFGGGLQFDFNYTFSKSIDISSDAERIAPYRGFGGQVINSWSPKQLRAVSDFDLPHQINANWIAELPFGKGRKFAGNSHGVTEALIGGWQVTGLVRWTSGFPTTVDNGYFFPTNWEEEGNAMQIAPVQARKTVLPGGIVSMFKNGPAAAGSFRNSYPGESGTRNSFRGDGFAGWDMSLGKRWKMPYAESNSLQFRWEVFNVTNLSRFDVQSNRPEIDIAGTFGNYTGLLTSPRVMQFALRYEF
jgi:hypothetical protein